MNYVTYDTLAQAVQLMGQEVGELLFWCALAVGFLMISVIWCVVRIKKLEKMVDDGQTRESGNNG